MSSDYDKNNTILIALKLFFSLQNGRDVFVRQELDMIMTNQQYQDLFSNETNTSSQRKKRKAKRDYRSRWPNKTVYYESFLSSFNPKERTTIQSALRDWQKYTCLKFKVVTHGGSTKNRVKFVSGKGCSSYVGMVNRKPQEITLAKGCRHKVR